MGAKHSFLIGLTLTALLSFGGCASNSGSAGFQHSFAVGKEIQVNGVLTGANNFAFPLKQGELNKFHIICQDGVVEASLYVQGPTQPRKLVVSKTGKEIEFTYASDYTGLVDLTLSGTGEIAVVHGKVTVDPVK